jgi:multicomponent Na+:H+ antiporter subunit G
VGVLEVIGTLFVVVGCLFALTGAVGVLRMPDFYSRLHPAGKSDTLAQALILFGLAFFAGQQLLVALGSEGGGHGDWIDFADIILKLALLCGLLLLTAPTATHAIAKAARLDHHSGISTPDVEPGGPQIAEVVVAGDVDKPLEEQAGPVLDVHHEEEGEP